MSGIETALITAGMGAKGAAIATNVIISTGLGLVQRALTPDQFIRQEGARLDASQITGSNEGASVNVVYGAHRVGGQVIWATKFLETVQTTSQTQGGKGGPKAVTETTEYLYSTSFALGLCQGRAGLTLGRVWADGNELDLADLTYRFYDGTESQVADPKIAAVETNAPAFRGLCYIVFEDMPLKNYGNRIPQLTVEVREYTQATANLLQGIVENVAAGGVAAAIQAALDDETLDPDDMPPTLGDILDDLTGDVTVDVTDIAGEYVMGLTYPSTSSPRDVIENLLQSFQIKVYEDDAKLVFEHRSTTTSASVVLDDLVGGADTYKKERVAESDLPDRTQVNYTDPGRDYQSASVDGHTVTGSSVRRDTFETLTAVWTSQARSLADILTHDARVRRDTVAFALPLSYRSINPGDVFTFAPRGVTRQYRVEKMSYGDTIEIEASGFEAEVYNGTSHAASDTLDDTGVVYTATDLTVAELPLITGDEVNPWSPRILVRQDPWPGGVNVFEDDGSGGYVLNGQQLVPAITGTTTTALASGRPDRWDTVNTVTLTLDDPSRYSLSSLSDQSVLNGGNFAAIRHGGSGDWEVFQFGVATLNGDGSYTLSRLLRGQLGTENQIADPHAAGAEFLFLDSERLGYLSGTVDRLGLDIDYRYGPVGISVSDGIYTDQTITARGVAYRPYAPCQLRQVQSGSDLVLSWIRRTRFGGDSWELSEVPLNEEIERYEIDIYDGPTVVRTLTVDDATTVTYTAAQQTADFGSTQSSVTWVIHQISTTYGRGSPANG